MITGLFDDHCKQCAGECGRHFSRLIVCFLVSYDANIAGYWNICSYFIIELIYIYMCVCVCNFQKCLHNPWSMHVSVGEIWDWLNNIWWCVHHSTSLAYFGLFWRYSGLPKEHSGAACLFAHVRTCCFAKGRRPNWSPCHGERTDRAFDGLVTGMGVEEFLKNVGQLPRPIMGDVTSKKKIFL